MMMSIGDAPFGGPFLVRKFRYYIYALKIDVDALDISRSRKAEALRTEQVPE